MQILIVILIRIQIQVQIAIQMKMNHSFTTLLHTTSGIHALCNIIKDEEITIFYDPKLIFLPTIQGHVKLLANYAFDCQCVRCICNINESDRNDNNSNKRLYKEIKKAILFEKLLKAAKYPKHLTNHKLAKEKYV